MKVPFWYEYGYVWYIIDGIVYVEQDSTRVCDCAGLAELCRIFVSDYLGRKDIAIEVCQLICKMLRVMSDLSDVDAVIDFCCKTDIRNVNNLSLSNLGLSLDTYDFSELLNSNEYCVLGTNNLGSLMQVRGRSNEFVVRAPIVLWIYNGDGVDELRLYRGALLKETSKGIVIDGYDWVTLSNIYIDADCRVIYDLKYKHKLGNDSVAKAVLALVNKGNVAHIRKENWLYQRRKK